MKPAAVSLVLVVLFVITARGQTPAPGSCSDGSVGIGQWCRHPDGWCPNGSSCDVPTLQCCETRICPTFVVDVFCPPTVDNDECNTNTDCGTGELCCNDPCVEKYCTRGIRA